MKKFWRLFLATVLVAPNFLSLVNAQDSTGFSDTGGTVSSEAVQFLKDQGVVEGYADGTYGVERDISRAEFLKIALKAAGVLDENCAEPNKTFPDVGSKDWFYAVVCTAVNQSVIDGYPDGSFKPNAPINFAEAAKIIAKIYKVQSDSVEGAAWFQGYVDGLARVRVTPGSVEGNGELLTRGEMAQMIWGLKTGREVENEKLGALPQIESCSELNAQLEKYNLRNGGGYWGPGIILPFSRDFDAGDGALTAPVPADAPQAESSNDAKSSFGTGGGADYSTTNVQESGVDEADIIKNNGTHIFVTRGNNIRIIRATPANDLQEIATIKLEDQNFYSQEMYVDGNTLVVVGNGGGGGYEKPYFGRVDPGVATDSIMIEPPYFYQNTARVVSFDISNPEKPKQIRSVKVEGNYLTSRKIGDTVYLVANDNNWNYWGGPIPLLKNDNMPILEDSAQPEEKIVAPCDQVHYFPNFQTPNMLTVAAIDVRDTSEKIGREVLLGAGEQVYGSQDNLYVTQNGGHEYWVQDGRFAGWRFADATDIFKFGLSGSTVDFKAKGRVEGRVLNQFSMSEDNGYFRIATEKGQNWWDNSEQTSSSVFVLDKNMKETGRIEDIAKGEHIKSVRFMGDKGYIVTFKTVDPLFVIDLTPANPKILGELKIPGWSDYLHPYDETHLIGFGKEVKPEAEGKDVLRPEDILGMKLSLFDVSDLSNPKELHKIVIGSRDTYSEALYNHKAILFDKAKGILGFPINITKEIPQTNYYNMKTIFSGAQLYDISVENGFTLRGQASNYTPEWYDENQGWFSGDYERNIQRLIYIGDHFYSIAPNFIQSLNWDDLKVVDTLQLDQKRCEEIWNQFECKQNPECSTVWQNYQECREVNGQTSCTDNKQFLRCESK